MSTPKDPPKPRQDSHEPDSPEEQPGTNAVAHEPDPTAKPIADGEHKFVPKSPFRSGND